MEQSVTRLGRMLEAISRFWWLLVIALVALAVYLILRHETHWVIATVLVVVTFLLGTLLPFLTRSGRWTHYRERSGRVMESVFVASEFGLRFATALVWAWAFAVVAYLVLKIGGLDGLLGALLFVGITMFLGSLAGLALGPLSLIRAFGGSLGKIAPTNFISRFLRRVAVIYAAGAIAWGAIMVVVIAGKI